LARGCSGLAVRDIDAHAPSASDDATSKKADVIRRLKVICLTRVSAKMLKGKRTRGIILKNVRGATVAPTAAGIKKHRGGELGARG
jgi:hypothetical protein